MTKLPKEFNSRHSLESFDPRYRELFRNALKADIELTFSSSGEARHFQTRFQMYRKRLLEVKDPEAKSFYSLKTSRKDNYLKIYRADAQFDEILEHFASKPSEPKSTFEPDLRPNGTPMTGASSQEISLDELFSGLTVEQHSSEPEE